MLSEYINSTEMLYSWARQAMPNICISDLDDYSIHHVARLLMIDRNPEIELTITRYVVTDPDNIRFETSDDVSIYHARYLRVYSEWDKYAEQIKVPEGWKEQPDIQQRAELFMHLKFYVNEEKKKTVIVSNNTGIEGLHYFAGLFRRMVPWLFTEKPLTDNEKQLLGSFFRDKYEDFSVANDHVMEDKREIIRDIKVNYLMGRFQTTLRANKIRGLERENENIRSRIDELFSRIATCNRDLQNNNIMLLGYRSMSNGQDKALIDFLKSDKDIDILETASNGDSVKLRIKTYCDEYDPDVMESMLQEDESLLYVDGYGDRYDCVPAFNDRANKKKLWQAIYNGTLKLRMVADYTLNIADNTVMGGYEDMITTCMPNPHIYHHHCIGSYKTQIIQMLMKGNIPGAIAICKASAGSVNLQETPTMNPFMADLYHNFADRKILEDRNGNLYTPVEALEVLGE